MTPTSGQQLRLLFCFFSSFLFSVLSLFFSAQAAFCKKNSSTLFCCKVSSWLQWAAQEFQLLSDSVNGFIQNFRVSGPDLCNYSRHHFLSRFSIKSCLIGKLCWISYHLLKSGLLYLLVMFCGSTCSCWSRRHPTTYQEWAGKILTPSLILVPFRTLPTLCQDHTTHHHITTPLTPPTMTGGHLLTQGLI